MALVGVFRLGVAADDARRLLTNRCCGWRRENKRTTKPNHVKLISLAPVWCVPSPTSSRAELAKFTAAPHRHRGSTPVRVCHFCLFVFCAGTEVACLFCHVHVPPAKRPTFKIGTPRESNPIYEVPRRAGGASDQLDQRLPTSD